jgi:hypothetical protein
VVDPLHSNADAGVIESAEEGAEHCTVTPAEYALSHDDPIVIVAVITPPAYTSVEGDMEV